METIQTRAQLEDFAARYGLRPDWHEPDEQGIDAYVDGAQFDNAFTFPTGWDHRPGDAEAWQAKSPYAELTVILRHERVPVAAINLATLLALAAGAQVAGS